MGGSLRGFGHSLSESIPVHVQWKQSPFSEIHPPAPGSIPPLFASFLPSDFSLAFVPSLSRRCNVSCCSSQCCPWRQMPPGDGGGQILWANAGIKNPGFRRGCCQVGLPPKHCKNAVSAPQKAFCFRDLYPRAPGWSSAPLHPHSRVRGPRGSSTGFVHPRLLAEGRTLLIYFIYSLWGGLSPL